MTLSGLSSSEVEQRKADGRSNDVEDPTSRTIAQIIRANVITPFNILLGILFVVILLIREYRDGLFGIVVIANALIGIVQEIRSKRAVDALAVLNSPHLTVMRDGVAQEIAAKDVVQDDIIVLTLGDQIVVDGERSARFNFVA